MEDTNAALVETSGSNQIADKLFLAGQFRLGVNQSGLAERLVDTSREIRHLRWITEPADLATLCLSLGSMIMVLKEGGFDFAAHSIHETCRSVLQHLPRHDPRVSPACRTLANCISRVMLRFPDRAHV